MPVLEAPPRSRPDPNGFPQPSDAYIEPECIELDEAGLEAAIEGTLQSVGCTYDELRQQAMADEFDSWQAEAAWHVISVFRPSNPQAA